MTAIAHPSLSDADDSNDSLLRFALRADATLCAGTGLLVAMSAEILDGLIGVSSTVGYLAGAALSAYGVLLYLLAALPDIRAVGVAVLIGNVCFAVTGVVAVAAHWLPLSPVGAELVLAFVAVTAVLSWLQHRGVRRLA
ncbi:hypothetical protein [Mycolicibacterium vaccae]|uniref:hypothetical protein n=1 Tax=Mycolicibacterium vaccae TaxID=1810 RepID=UPI003D02749E